MRRRSIATDIAIKIGKFRIGLPTFVLIYINITIGSLILMTTVRSESDPYVDYVVGGGNVWPALLILTSVVTLHGLLSKNTRITTLGSFGGFLLWAVDLVFWMMQGSLYFDIYTSLWALPMMLFFAFVHIKYSLLQRYERGRHVELI